MRKYCTAGFCVLLFTASLAWCDPATAPAPGNLQGTVTGVRGMVQVKFAANQAWQTCMVGMAVDQGTQFRTGLRSAVQFQIPPDQTVTLDRLGTITLLQAVNENGKVVTDLGMQYGRTRYEINAAGIQHVSTIHSPNSTLAVRGTTVSLTDQRPFAPEAVSLTGTAQYFTAKREISVGGHNTGIATAVGNLSPADAALLASVVDPSSEFAREPAEQPLITTVLSRGSVVTENKSAGIPIVTGGIPPTDQQILAGTTDPLDFILRWTGNTNLNLYIDAPDNASDTKTSLIYPATGLNISPTGGTIPFDNQGGPNGGFEVAEFPGPVLKGGYGIGIIYVSGQPTSFTADAYLNGKPVQLFTGNIFSSQTQLTGTIGPRPANLPYNAAIGLVGIKSILDSGGAAQAEMAAMKRMAK